MKASLQDVLITGQLSHRPDRPILSTFTNSVMAELDRLLAEEPARFMEEAGRAAMILPGAQSGGVSVVEQASSACRTRAIEGRWAKQPGGSALLDAVLCPLALERKTLLLFAYPERCFAQLEAVYPPIVEALMAPFFDGERPAGVVWAVFHTNQVPFDVHDGYMINDLARLLTSVHPRMTALGHL